MSSSTTTSLPPVASDTPVSNPPVDCVETQSAWSTCSAQGIQTSTWTIKTEASDGGKACQFKNGQEVTQKCTPPKQPVDCVENQSAWTSCTAEGIQTSTWTVTVKAANGGKACKFTDGQVVTQNCTPPPNRSNGNRDNFQPNNNSNNNNFIANAPQSRLNSSPGTTNSSPTTGNSDSQTPAITSSSPNLSANTNSALQTSQDQTTIAVNAGGSTVNGTSVTNNPSGSSFGTSSASTAVSSTTVSGATIGIVAAVVIACCVAGLFVLKRIRSNRQAPNDTESGKFIGKIRSNSKSSSHTSSSNGALQYTFESHPALNPVPPLPPVDLGEAPLSDSSVSPPPMLFSIPQDHQYKQDGRDVSPPSMLFSIPQDQQYNLDGRDAGTSFDLYSTAFQQQQNQPRENVQIVESQDRNSIDYDKYRSMYSEKSFYVPSTPSIEEQDSNNNIMNDSIPSEDKNKNFSVISEFSTGSEWSDMKENPDSVDVGSRPQFQSIYSDISVDNMVVLDSTSTNDQSNTSQQQQQQEKPLPAQPYSARTTSKSTTVKASPLRNTITFDDLSDSESERNSPNPMRTMESVVIGAYSGGDMKELRYSQATDDSHARESWMSDVSHVESMESFDGGIVGNM